MTKYTILKTAKRAPKYKSKFSVTRRSVIPARQKERQKAAITQAASAK
jgi:hypothetical protein